MWRKLPMVDAFLSTMFVTAATTKLLDPTTYFSGALTQNFVSSAMMVLITYDHALTFSQEVSHFWGRKPTFVTVFFFVNRYSALVYGVLNLVSGLVVSARGCTVLTRLTQLYTVLLMIMFGVWSSLRVYALWRGTILLPVAVFVISLVQVAVNIYLFSKATPVITHLANASCLAYLPVTESMRTKVVALARAATLCADVSVLVVTWLRTYRIHRDAAKLNVRRPVTTLLIRDGTLYFLVVFMLNITHLIVFHTEGQIFLVSFICSLSAILASRFLLNFRQLGGCGVFTELSQCNADDVAFSTTAPRDRCEHLETTIALRNVSRPRVMIQKDVAVHTRS